MNYIGNGTVVGIARKEKRGKHLLLQHTVFIHRVAYKPAERVAQFGRCAHQSFGGGVTVVDINATVVERPAHKRLAGTYASCYRYSHFSVFCFRCHHNVRSAMPFRADRLYAA